ncbi:MAG TPA: NAD(P)-dependent alcohol dehydrogenase [Alphaproteobacteria bacterium]|nr:NAD(P)-dependent alcohol dehydrogenase [Alphaproteobacteria bacterium]
MQAYHLLEPYGFAALRPVELARPEPGPGEVLVRVRAVSLNYRDLLIVKGDYSRRLKLPLVPGSDGAGEVAAVGPGVSRFAPGDRVVAAFFQRWLKGPIGPEARASALGAGYRGMLAEYVVLDEAGLLPVPAHLSFAEAACLPCAGVTAWHALEADEPAGPGATVLTQGTGGVSIFALQLAKLRGCRVIATSSRDERCRRLEALGADATINYRTTPEWDQRVLKLTEGLGCDRIVEVGGAGTLERSLRALRPGGLVAVIGVLSGKGASFDPMPIIMKSARLYGISVGSKEMFEAMNRTIIAHSLHPVIDRTFPFAELQAALRHMEAGAHFGKICLAL